MIHDDDDLKKVSWQWCPEDRNPRLSKTQMMFTKGMSMMRLSPMPPPIVVYLYSNICIAKCMREHTSSTRTVFGIHGI